MVINWRSMPLINAKGKPVFGSINKKLNECLAKLIFFL
jgi:hypothetical protein